MTNPLNNDDLLSITQFAAIVSRSRQTVYNWIEKGDVHAELVAGRWCLSRAEADAIQAKQAPE